MVGRIGCFCAGCCYGIEWEHGLMYNASSVAPHDVRLVPAQLIESACNFVILFVLMRAAIACWHGQDFWYENMSNTTRNVNWKTALITVGISFVIAALLSVLWQTDGLGFFWSNLIGYGMIVAPAVFVCAYKRVSPETIGLKGMAIRANLFGGALLLLMIFALPPIMQSAGVAFSWRSISGQVLWISIFSAVFEEFLFRGYLQNALTPWAGKWKSFLLVALIFSFFHLPQRIFTSGTLSVDTVFSCIQLIPGALLLGITEVLFDNIYACIWLHLIGNIIIFSVF
ncbi:MAG: prolipoprotein diacylglyceryl transferase family protein [Christensenellaceae bacterium]|jgi:membrane protease YdiL (CAAX protease family)